MIAVVVPSRDRAAPLARLLDALDRQDVTDFEVAVVLDGSTDGSARMLASRRDSFPLQWRHQDHRGAAAARNAGAAMTTAPVVLFLDDDVEPDPDLVSRHAAHHDGSRRVVVGDCPIVLPQRPGPHDVNAWAWWLDFNHRRAAGVTTSYRDVCAGNLSVRRADLLEAGGFDEGFVGYGAEDWELGVRLLDAGVEVVVDPLAIARHHRRHTVAEIVAHARSEGRADVHFGRRHRSMRGGLRLAYVPRGDIGVAARRAFDRPAHADLDLRIAVARLAMIKRLRRWGKRFDEVRAIAYWWGVAETLGSWTAYESFVADVDRASTTVDVRAGLPARVDAPPGVPCVVHVRWGEDELGTFTLPASAPRDGAELAHRISAQLSGQLLLRVSSL